MNSETKYVVQAAICFFLSTIFTWWFIAVSTLYQTQSQELLSCSIAGGKWSLQILPALLFLKEKKWSFIYGISLVCLIGSIMLLPYCAARLLGFADNSAFFVDSLIASVVCMLALYYRIVRKNQVGLHWIVFFAIALFVAVSLQLTVVFQVIKL
jgi:hypothetical protein